MTPNKFARGAGGGSTRNRERLREHAGTATARQERGIAAGPRAKQPTPLRPNRGKKKAKPTRSQTKDGRVILRGTAYMKLREEVGKAANERCAKCGRSALIYADNTFLRGHLHHRNGRGGGRRNDTAESAVWLCWLCHWQIHSPKACPSKKVANGA